MPMFTPMNTEGFTSDRLAQMNADYDRIIASLVSDDPDYAEDCVLIADRIWRSYELARFITS